MTAFGSATGHTYPDKLQVIVSEVTRFTPSSSAAGFVAGQVGVFTTLTLINGSSQPVGLDLMTVDMTAGATSAAVESVFDDSAGLGAELSGSLAPGRRASAKYGFAVPPADLAQLVVVVQPDLEHPEAKFSGTIS